jgi:glycosyltransferase involved in cell wall biosynthesis
MNEVSGKRCVIYAEFIDHRAGIGSDMRMVISSLKALGIKSTYANYNSNKAQKLKSLFKMLVIGPKTCLNADFVYSPHVLPRIYNLPNIVRVHDIFPLTNPEWFTLKQRVYFRIAIKSQLSSYFLFDSITTKNEFTNYFGKIDSNDFSIMYCSRRTLEIDDFCNTCEGCIRVNDKKEHEFALAVGTVEPRKNYEFLIANWLQATEELDSKPELIIVGSRGWKSSSLIKKLKKNANGVIWLGSICDSSLRILYSTSTFFISASKAEGFNLPVNEAISFGNQVVLSDIPVHRELYETSAEYFQLDSPQSFCQKVKELFLNPNQSQPNVEIIGCKFDDQNVSTSVLRLAIEKALAK